MNSKIIKLTKIFLIDYYQKLNILKKDNKINYSSFIFWSLLIICVFLIYCSSKSLKYLSLIGQEKLFLKIALPIIAVLIIFQILLIICNIFYYSKDLEYIIHLPLSSKEILFAKFNTLLVIVYMMEAIFLIIPLIMYGLLIEKTILYFVSMIFVLFVFPTIYILIINIFMFFIMKISKIIRNKEMFHLVVIGAVIFLMFFISGIYLKNVFESNVENISILEEINIKMDKINDKLVIINPIIDILTNDNILEKICNILKLILINFIFINIYIYFGNKMYLKNILININNINNKIKINNKYKYKKNKIINSYIKNDIKKVIRNPIFLLQNIIQYIYVAVIFLLLLYTIFDPILYQIKKENFIEQIGINNFSFQGTLIILGYFQTIYTFSNLTITAISREGKDARFMKYIPIDLYKQVKIKILPQIIINTIIIFLGLFIIFLKIGNIKYKYYLSIFILSMLLNIIYNYLTILIDLKNPNINWINKETIVKNSKNKILQYAITIIIFIILYYFSHLFKDVDFMISINSIILIFLLILIIIKIYIKKYIKKLFEKIY